MPSDQSHLTQETSLPSNQVPPPQTLPDEEQTSGEGLVRVEAPAAEVELAVVRAEAERAIGPPRVRGAVHDRGVPVAGEDLAPGRDGDADVDHAGEEEPLGEVGHLLAVGRNREALQSGREVPCHRRPLRQPAHEEAIAALGDPGHRVLQLALAAVVEGPLRERLLVGALHRGEQKAPQELAEVAVDDDLREAEGQVHAAKDVRVAGHGLQARLERFGLGLELGRRHPRHQVEVLGRPRECAGVVQRGLVQTILAVGVHHRGLHVPWDAPTVLVEQVQDDVLQHHLLPAGRHVGREVGTADRVDQSENTPSVPSFQGLENRVHENLPSDLYSPKSSFAPNPGARGLPSHEKSF